MTRDPLETKRRLTEVARRRAERGWAHGAVIVALIVPGLLSRVLGVQTLLDGHRVGLVGLTVGLGLAWNALQEWRTRRSPALEEERAILRARLALSDPVLASSDSTIGLAL